MSIAVYIKLDTGTGISTGPFFELYSDVDSYVTPFETTTKTQLTNGYTSLTVPNSTTIVRVKSIGTCTNYSDFIIEITPTPTPTLTSTPTPTPTTAYELYTADRYTCDTPSGPCTYVETLQIANPTVLNTGKFYLDSINGYVFNIVGGPISGPYLYTNMGGLGTNNCSSLCSI